MLILTVCSSSRSSVYRAPNCCLGGHWFDSCRGLRLFLCPPLVSCCSIYLSHIIVIKRFGYIIPIVTPVRMIYYFVVWNYKLHRICVCDIIIWHFVAFVSCNDQDRNAGIRDLLYCTNLLQIDSMFQADRNIYLKAFLLWQQSDDLRIFLKSWSKSSPIYFNS